MEFYCDTASRTPIYLQLIEQVRRGVALGKLATGTRLPSVRQLSRELVVNPNTIARAYTELERDGVLNTRPGLGVFVAQPQAELSDTVRRDRLRAALDLFFTEAVLLGFSAEEVLETVRTRIGQYKFLVPKSPPEDSS